MYQCLHKFDYAVRKNIKNTNRYRAKENKQIPGCTMIYVSVDSTKYYFEVRGSKLKALLFFKSMQF